MWDIAPVHMVLLPNGKVMFWPGDYITGDDARLWDPATKNTLTSLSKATYDLFCAGHTLMSDGNLFVPGGNLLTPFNRLRQCQHLQSGDQRLDTVARHECGSVVSHHDLDGYQRSIGHDRHNR